jgi:hypothetical protein
LETLHLWFYARFFGGFSCLKMSPRLIVTVIRHLHTLSAMIADHPLSKLGARLLLDRLRKIWGETGGQIKGQNRKRFCPFYACDRKAD